MRIKRQRAPSNGSQPTSTEGKIEKFGQLHVLDDLIRLRAADTTQLPILAYPTSEKNDGYEYFTGQDFDQLVDQAVRVLMGYGFTTPHEDPAVVALFTLSDFNMVITFFALSRLGYTVMMLSPRLSAVACVSLLDAVGCDTVLYGETPSIRTTLDEVLRLKLVACRPIIQRPSKQARSTANTVPVLHRNRNPEAEQNKIAIIIHSSGSTGMPKPLFLSHKALMTHPLRGPGLTSFNSLPWYHLHGLSTALQAMWMRKTAFMWNESLPLTASNLSTALEAASPESVHAVPYVLQLLVDSPRGLEALRACKLVTYGGAPCPDELGNRLVKERVKFGGSFGLTEAGLVAESISRPANDPYWNYMRFFDSVQPYVWMKPISDSLYECVYLAGHPALTTSNSDDPPGSFHSRDVFTPHPTLPNRWKYVTRLDDRVTLVNGEKVLPLPIEGCIKQHPLIQEAVVVGVGKAAPGLLVFRAEESKDLSDEEYLDAIWPSIEEANSRAEQFSQITRDMVTIMPFTSDCPRTDKGSMIRAQVYQKFANEIEILYTKVDNISGGTLALDSSDTQNHLMKLCREELDLSLSTTDAEFFTEGVDSLKAMHLRRLILRDFKLDGCENIGQNIVFETGNISRLAEKINDIQNGWKTTAVSELSMMPKLIDKYSSFHKHIPGPNSATDKKTVILTGATGSMGAHILYELVHDPSISRVYCFTRRMQAMNSVLEALVKKRLHISPTQTQKITALKTSLDKPNFSFTKETLTEMRNSVSLIIHTAWPVNFNLPLSSFEPHIKGLYNLINFSLSVTLPSPAVILFCSSISTALNSSSLEISETPMKDLTCALNMGYARSKLIGERMISNSRLCGARAYSLRNGQVSGHSKKGLWNDSEAIPLLVRSCLTLKALPELPEYAATCSWIPVDKLACSILEIASVCEGKPAIHQDIYTPQKNMYPVLGKPIEDDSVYNLCNSRTFTWTSLLTTLQQNGFVFETVPFDTWLSMLRNSESRGEELVNPAVKLTEHYEAMYGNSQGDEKVDNDGGDGGSGRGTQKKQGKVFRTEKAERDSLTLRNGRLRIIEDGILARYARDWLKRWKK